MDRNTEKLGELVKIDYHNEGSTQYLTSPDSKWLLAGETFINLNSIISITIRNDASLVGLWIVHPDNSISSVRLTLEELQQVKNVMLAKL